jgi:uracil-DNA glycosylase
MSWIDFHSQEIKKPYYKNLQEKIDYFYSKDVQFFTGMFPPKELIFKCFDETPLDKVRVVILGQDPYHGKGQANGLAFAVNKKVQIPLSLKNIIKESNCKDTTLLKWAKQGVLLLNTILTVRESKPMSCTNIGWETYTDNAIKYLLEKSDPINPLIFCLWVHMHNLKKE